MIAEIQQILDGLKHSSHLDLSQALFSFVRMVKKYSKSDVCSLYLLNREKDHYALMATRGLKADTVRKISLAANEGLVGLIVTRGEALNITNPKNHPNYKYLPQTGEEQFHSFLGFPITHHSEVLGVLVLQRKKSERFTPQEEAFMLTLVAQLSEVITLWDYNGDLQRITRQDWRGKKETILRALAGSPGVVIGKGLLLQDDALEQNYALERSKNKSVEKELFYNAIEKTMLDIKQQERQLIGKISDQERFLFTTYVQMLDDNNMGGETATLIDKGFTAISSWNHIINQHCQAFEAISDAYLKERASDIRDLGKRVMSYLKPYKGLDKTSFHDQTIIVAREVTPAMLALVPLEKLSGIVSLKGSSNSHLCILAKALEIPAIVGVEGLKLNRIDNQTLVLDGSEGRLYIRPTKQRIQEFRKKQINRKLVQRQLEKLHDDPTITTDGHSVQLLVNTGLMADARNSLERGAEGVGLYRSEVPFFHREYMPTEFEQETFYRQQLQLFAPREVTMRTLDVGGDKPLPFLSIDEANPFLGWRGIRISLDHPDWFLNQVKSMMRASEGLDNLKILLPMISGTTELDDALVLIKQAYKEVTEDEKCNIKQPQIGTMIEVPSAVYMIQQLASRVDFISVGSNDLTQYLLAVDRNNPRVADWYQPFHPAVIQALHAIAKGTKKQKKHLAICGEMAGEPKAAILLVAMGYEALSMSSSRLMLIKAVINAIDNQQAKLLLKDVLTLPSTEQIEGAIDGFISRLPKLTELLKNY